MCASIKEDSQRTTTLTDYLKERDYKNEGSSMHEDSCIGINYAHRFSQVFQVTSHIVEFFAVYFVSSILIVVAVPIFIQFLTCTRIPVRDSHCDIGSFEVLSLHTPSVLADDHSSDSEDVPTCVEAPPAPAAPAVAAAPERAATTLFERLQAIRIINGGTPPS